MGYIHIYIIFFFFLSFLDWWRTDLGSVQDFVRDWKTFIIIIIIIVAGTIQIIDGAKTG